MVAVSGGGFIVQVLSVTGLIPATQHFDARSRFSGL
jgi:hypothetical protein